LIGAERSFILTPFIWEGVIEGLLGAGFSLFLLLCIKWFFSGVLAQEWNSALGISSWIFLSFGQVFLLGFIGITMALLGSVTVFFRTVDQVR
jgi:cell division protein FtsX